MRTPAKLANLAVLAAAVVLAWRWRHATGLAGLIGHTLAVLLAVSVVIVVIAVVRDTWTEQLTGSPEAPEPPDWATPRQRRVWALLHALDFIAEPAPKRAVPAPHRGRRTPR